MPRQIQGGAAIPVAVIDPETRQVQGGAALPVVNLGDPIQSIQFITNPGDFDHSEGLIFWDNAAGTLSIMTDIQNVVIQVGQESQVVVRNNTGSTIANGQVVYVSGAIGFRPTVALSLANAQATALSVGMATEAIEKNQNGRVTMFGLVRDIDTSDFDEGDMVWVSAAVAGALTNIEPTFPDFPTKIGTVLRAHNNQGVILVDVDNPTIKESGSLYTADSIATQALTAGVETKLTLWDANGPSQISTPDHTNDQITVVKAGIYEISAQFSHTSSVDNVLFEFRFAVNGVSSVLRCERTIETNTDIGSASFIGPLQLEAGDVVSVNIESDTDTNFTLRKGQFNVKEL